MVWLRKASVWAGPNGEIEEFTGSHGASGTKILTKLFMAEEMGKSPSVIDTPSGPKVEDKGLSGEQAKARALERLQEAGDGPWTHNELFNRHWVLIDDEGKRVPSVMGRNRSDIVKVKEAITPHLSEGPVLLMFDGSGSGVELTMDDVNSAKSFDQAIEIAENRVPVAANLSCDFGIWMSKKNWKINF